MDHDNTRWPDLTHVAPRLTDSGRPAEPHPASGSDHVHLYVNNPHTGQQLRVGPGTPTAGTRHVWCGEATTLELDHVPANCGQSTDGWHLLPHADPETDLVRTVLHLFGHIPAPTIGLEDLAGLSRTGREWVDLR